MTFQQRHLQVVKEQLHNVAPSATFENQMGNLGRENGFINQIWPLSTEVLPLTLGRVSVGLYLLKWSQATFYSKEKQDLSVT